MAANILIIDSDPSITSVFEFILGQQGHQVHTASSAAKGIATVKTEPIDLAFLDCNLPQPGAFQCIETILKSNSRVPVVMMCNFEIEKDTLSKIYEKGAYGIIYKPFDIEEAMTIIDSIFKSKKKAS